MKKHIAVVALAAAAAVALAGCAGSPGSSSSGGHVDLTFWHGYTEADGKVLDQIVDDFNASQSTVTITTQTKTWGVIDDTMLPALSAKKGPDLVAMTSDRLPVYAQKKALVDLDDFYDQSSSNTAELKEQAVAMETVDGIAADKLFTAGKTAMEIGGPWMAGVAKASGIDYGIAAIPAGPKAQVASAIGISLGVTAQTDDAKRAAAEQFLSYFNEKTVAAKWALGSGWPPLRTDVTAADVDANPTVATLTGLPGKTVPLLPGVVDSGDVLTAIDTATQKSMAGGDPAALLATADSTIQSALK